MGLKSFTELCFKKKPSISIGDAVAEEKVKARSPAMKVTNHVVGSVARRSPGKRSPLQYVLRPMPSGSLNITESEPMYRSVPKSGSERAASLKTKPGERPLFNEAEITVASALAAAAKRKSPPPPSVMFSLTTKTIPVLPSESNLPPSRPDRPGKVTSLKASLDLEALKTLAMVKDQTKVLTVREFDIEKQFVASNNARKTTKQARDCADCLRANPLIGAFLPSDDFLTVGDLQVALGRLEAD